MGETAYLMQAHSFSYASGLPNEASERNPMHALGQSISFGRFMTESLEWEKWSAFNSNSKRYVQEAEKYSRPGSVAQKKAFFEAHYKNIAARKAAAFLEQSNNPKETEEPVGNNNTAAAAAAATQEPQEAWSEKRRNPVLPSDTAAVFKASGDGSYGLNFEGNAPKRQSSQSVPEKEVCAGNSTNVELQSQAEHYLNQMDTDEDKEWNSNSVPEEKALITKDKPSVVSLVNKEAPRVPTPPAMLKQPIFATTASKELRITFAEKRRTPTNSPFTSVYFSPLRGLNRLSATIMKKIKNSKVGSSSSRTSEDYQTPAIMLFESQSTHSSSRKEESTARRKKDKAKTGTWKLGHCFCFNARPGGMEGSKNVIKQVPLSNFEQFNKVRSTRSVDSKSSVHPQTSAIDNGRKKVFPGKERPSLYYYPNIHHRSGR